MIDTQTAKKFTFDVGWVFVGSIITLFIGFLLRIVFGNILGASGLGLYSMTLIIYSIATLVGAVGIPTATVKYVAEYKENKTELNTFVSCSIINSLLFGIVAALALYFLSETLANVFNMPELTHLIKIVSFALPFFVVSTTLLRLFNGLRKMGLYSFGLVLRSVLVFGFSVVFISIGWGVEGVVSAIVLSEVVVFVLLLLLSRRFFQFTLANYARTTKKLVSFGSRSFIGEGTHLLDTNIDMLMIGYFLMDKDVGIYAIAIAISGMILMIPSAMSQVTYPMISEFNGKNTRESIKATIIKSTRYSFILSSVLGLILIFISKSIISLLLPPEFLPAVLPLAILIFAIIFYSSMVSVGSAFHAVDRPDIPSKVNTVAVIINFSLNAVLIPILGIVGAAIASSTTYILRTVICFFLFDTILHVRVNGRWFAQVIGIISLIILIFFIVNDWINPYLLISLLMGIYVILINKFLLIKEDKEDIKLIAKQIFKIT